MSWFGKLFGTDKATASLIDNVSNGLDKLIYTDEEKAEDIAEARREGRAVVMEWLRSTSGSRIARRLIALVIVLPWTIQHLAAQVVAVAAIWSDDPDRLEKTSKLLFEAAQGNNALVGVVLLFYFGGPAGIEMSKALVAKWVNRGNSQ